MPRLTQLTSLEAVGKLFCGLRSAQILRQSRETCTSQINPSSWHRSWQLGRFSCGVKWVRLPGSGITLGLLLLGLPHLDSNSTSTCYATCIHPTPNPGLDRFNYATILIASRLFLEQKSTKTYENRWSSAKRRNRHSAPLRDHTCQSFFWPLTYLRSTKKT